MDGVANAVCVDHFIAVDGRAQRRGGAGGGARGNGLRRGSHCRLRGDLGGGDAESDALASGRNGHYIPGAVLEVGGDGGGLGRRGSAEPGRAEFKSLGIVARVEHLIVAVVALADWVVCVWVGGFVGCPGADLGGSEARVGGLCEEEDDS